MNREKFKKLVKEKTGSGALISETMRVLSCGKNTACDKLNGNRFFRADEIEKFRTEYGMTDSEVIECFIEGG